MDRFCDTHVDLQAAGSRLLLITSPLTPDKEIQIPPTPLPPKITEMFQLPKNLLLFGFWSPGTCWGARPPCICISNPSLSSAAQTLHERLDDVPGLIHLSFYAAIRSSLLTSYVTYQARQTEAEELDNSLLLVWNSQVLSPHHPHNLFTSSPSDTSVGKPAEVESVTSAGCLGKKEPACGTWRGFIQELRTEQGIKLSWSSWLRRSSTEVEVGRHPVIFYSFWLEATLKQAVDREVSVCSRDTEG